MFKRVMNWLDEHGGVLGNINNRLCISCAGDCEYIFDIFNGDSHLGMVIL